MQFYTDHICTDHFSGTEESGPRATRLANAAAGKASEQSAAGRGEGGQFCAFQVLSSLTTFPTKVRQQWGGGRGLVWE